MVAPTGALPKAPQRHYTALILDFDGTLFDTRRAILATLEATFAAHGRVPPPRNAIEATIRRGITLEATLAQLRPNSTTADELSLWAASYRRIYNAGIGIRASTPFPESRTTLLELDRAAIPIVVASNKGEASVHATLVHFDLHRFVRLVVAARDSHPTKPDPRSYTARIAPILGPASCERVLVVGDTEVDLHYARSIGATACWAAYGYGDAEACRQLEPDLIATSLGEVSAIVRGAE